MNSFQGNSWEVVLSPDWVGEHSDECLMMHQPDEVGALKISAHSKNKPVAQFDLNNLVYGNLAI